MKLTKRTLRKLIKEEFKTSRLAENEGELDADARAGGGLSRGDLEVIKQLLRRLSEVAAGQDENGNDIELMDHKTLLAQMIQKVEQATTGQKGGGIERKQAQLGKTGGEITKFGRQLTRGDTSGFGTDDKNRA
jgi:hypothetical protein